MLLPALIEDDGRALFQSLAIIEYLDEIRPNPPLLPRDPWDRARVRGLALMVACDAHPLMVPRVRNYLEHEFKLDEAQRLKWIRHWINEALKALEAHLSRDSKTGPYCHGDSVSMADLCLVSHAVGAKLFNVEVAPYPTVARIVDTCLKQDAFARAHPLKQPGAPATVTH
jgi:maleylacetoacetate isomerase/maleylpyruvate isomerase